MGRVQAQPEEWTNRIEKLQARVREAGWQGCLVTQNIGIYYYTGTMQTGYLFVPAEGSPTFYVRRSLQRAERESKVRTAELASFREFGKQLANDYSQLACVVVGEPDKLVIGADLDVMPAQLYVRLADAIPQAAVKDASSMLREARSMKSPYEIERISAAANVAADGLEAGLASLKEGTTELELMAVIENAMRLRGHIGLMRMRGYNQEIMTGVVAAGEAAAEPTYFDGPAGGRGLSEAAPQSASTRPIRRGEPILIDIGCCVDGYTIDQTRTAVIGELRPELLFAYETAVSIIRGTETMLKPGAIPEELYAEAMKMASEAGLLEHFMGYGRDQVKFLGHGIGLEIDEWPVLARGFRAPLEPGMVIAVEPKFTFPAWGVVGIENTYVVTETGCRPLTRSPERLITLPL
ncbi:M24 family metallopeptidase [Cohnella sp. GCM10027633]|uniref:M24 family metallopeptidase n=1 Tax=unclassified Cohnella TaxID=2636738 RepID=UPI00363C9D57